MQLVRGAASSVSEGTGIFPKRWPARLEQQSQTHCSFLSAEKSNSDWKFIFLM